MTGQRLTRQEFTDAVAEVIGVQPRLEVKVDTITRLADLYAATLVDAALEPHREVSREPQRA